MPRPRFDFFARLRMIGLAGLLLALSACSQIKGVAAPDPTLMQALARGVNLSHWFTHRTAFAAPSDQAIIGAADLTLIRQLGLDHVRIGVDPVWFNASAGAADELMRGLEAVRDAGLAVVLAVQPEADYKRALIADPAAREDLLRIWAQLATPLAQWPPSKLAFEALNEPEHNDPVAVHQLMTDIVATLRDAAPRHTVIVSPGAMPTSMTWWPSHRWRRTTSSIPFTFTSRKTSPTRVRTGAGPCGSAFQAFLIRHHRPSWRRDWRRLPTK